MKKSIYFPLLLITLVGATLFSACTDDDDNEAGTLSQSAYNAIVDSICGASQYLDTAYVSRYNLLFCSKFEKDGNVYELAYHDTLLSVSKGVEATIDTIRMTWDLDKTPLGTNDGKTYYNLNIHYRQADNNGPFQYLKSVSLKSGAEDEDGRLIAEVDANGAVELYLVNDSAATRGLGIIDFIVSIGTRLWKKVDAQDETELWGRSDLGDWMQNIQDDVPVCKMSIPGTHDTFTYLCRLSALWGQTQRSTIEEQWNRGVRCFDVRITERPDMIPAYTTGIDPSTHMSWLTLTHGGKIDLDIRLDEAMDEIYSLVHDKHPSETAIVVLKFDCNETDLDIAIVDAYLQSIQKKDELVMWKPDLTMREARGKIIVVARYMSKIESGVAKAFKKNEPGCPTSIGENNVWENNRTDSYLMDCVQTALFDTLQANHKTARLFVQDKYEQGSDQKPTAFWAEKEKLMRATFDSINKPPYVDQCVWAFNHTSGYIAPIIGGYISFKNMAEMNYPQNAWKMNPVMEGLLQNDYKEAYTGIVVMDFAGLSRNVPGGLIGAPFNVNCQTLPETIIKHNNALSWKGIKFTKKDF